VVKQNQGVVINRVKHFTTATFSPPHTRRRHRIYVCRDSVCTENADSLSDVVPPCARRARRRQGSSVILGAPAIALARARGVQHRRA
jgi:hypothetical protein